MPQIAAADVTYSEIVGLAQASPSAPITERGIVVSFGNGTLTYTSGGIPLTKAKLGCPASVQSMVMMDNASSTGYVPKLDYANLKIRLYQNDTAAVLGQLIEVATSAVVPAVVLKVLVAGF